VLATKHIRERISRLPELRTVQVERRDLRITVGTTGTIEPEEIVEVGAGVAGKILQFGEDPDTPKKTVDVGSRVAKGAVLFQLERELYEIAREKALAALTLAEAEVGRLRTQLEQAKRNLERAQRLRSTNSESDFDNIATAYEMAESGLEVGLARLAQAKAEAKQAEITLLKTTIRSPIDGVVIDRRANIGQHVLPAGPGLFLIAKDLTRMRIRASVSETDIGKIFPGQPVTFTVDAHRDQPMKGRVEKIQLNARMQGNFVTYDVFVTIEPSETELLPHMTADVEFEVIRRDNAWLVPIGALGWWPKPEQIACSSSTPDRPAHMADEDQQLEGEDGIVWAPAGRGLVRPVPVRIGIDDGVLTEVAGEGIRENMPVVVGNVKRTTLARVIPGARKFH